MKTLTFFLLIILLSLTSQAQTVYLDTSPSSAEIGISTTFTAHFDDQNIGGITVVKYEWSIPYIGAGISGPSGIEGSIDGFTTNVDPYIVTTSDTSNSIDVIWGDFFDVCTDNIYLRVFYLLAGSEVVITLNPAKMVNLFCVSTPSISGPSTIQECCNDNVVFCDSNPYGTQDGWDWTVTGGATLVSGDGTSCITVTPSTDDNFSVECIAFRQNGSSAYNRTSTKNVTRFQPQTPAITGPNFVCKGQTVTLCVAALCDQVGVVWSDASGALPLTSGQGTTCAVYTPDSLASNGTVVTLTAQTRFNDCTTTVSSYNVTIYDTGTPPTPNGSVTIVFPEPYDPCSDEEYEYVIIYNGTYDNGIITVSPHIVIDVPHHHVYDQFDVEVCYRNLCGGGVTCRTYHMYLPNDCEEDPDPIAHPTDLLPSKVKAEGDIFNPSIHGRSTNISSSLDEHKVYPNPAKDVITIESPINSECQIQLYDINGRLLEKSKWGMDTTIKFDISSLTESGVYILQLSTGDKIQYSKIIIQK